MSTSVAPPVRRLERFTWRTLVGLLAVVGAGAGFGVLFLLVRSRWRPLADADAGVAQSLNDLVAGDRTAVQVLHEVTDLGGRPIMIWMVAVVIIGLFLRRRHRLAVFLIVTGVGALALDPALKLIVGRLRPVVEVPIAAAPGNSFPSGHALGATVTYGALLLVFLPAIRARWRPYVIGLVATVVLAVGLTRMALGVHFLSDVVAGWLLGAAWLGVTGYAFRLWRLETGRPVAPLSEGLEPEAGHDVAPAPDEPYIQAHPWLSAFELLTTWVLTFGTLFVFGTVVSRYADGTPIDRLDTEVPLALADSRTPDLDDLSYWLSRLGDTHSILAVSLISCALIVAALRRWRPVLFVAVVMFGELGLFLATAAAVDRPRPPVELLDGKLPTSSFPSGHIAATLCLYSALALIIFPRTRAWWRWLPVAAAVLFPIAVALSRMYRGMHHPSDVLGAMLLTTLWVASVWWVVKPNADLGGRRSQLGWRRPAGAQRPPPAGAEAGDDAKAGDRAEPSGAFVEPGDAADATSVEPGDAADAAGAGRRAGTPAEPRGAGDRC